MPNNLKMPYFVPVEYLDTKIGPDDGEYRALAVELALRPKAGEELWYWSSARDLPPDVHAGTCGHCVVRDGRILRVQNGFGIH